MRRDARHACVIRWSNQVSDDIITSNSRGGLINGTNRGIIAVVIGLGAGIAVGWLLHSVRSGTEIARLDGRREEAEKANAQLVEQFKATAADVLQSNSKQFMELSEQNLGKTMEQAKSELERRHREFQELVKPLSDNYGKLNPQIEVLTKQTGELSSALTNNQ